MLKVKFFPQKICGELSAKQKSEGQQILSLQIRLVMLHCGQFVKDFSTVIQSFTFFYYAA